MSDATRTVVIVEDNEDNLFVYSAYLRHHGIAVLDAGDGPTGLAMIAEHLPDAVIMDVSIPIIDGWEATRRLKADPATASIPVLVLTAHALPEDRARAIEVGADSYLAKPAEPRVVYNEVLSLFRQQPLPSDPVPASASPEV
jgi:two-component system cell cycle response regulator DivK